MHKRNFWRRAIAYFIDILFCGAIATIIILLVGLVLPVQVIAPEFVKSSRCETRDDLFTQARMQELMPLEAGQQHVQILCRQTNMFVSITPMSGSLSPR